MSLIEGMKILDNLSFNQNLKPDNILLDSKMIHKIIDFKLLLRSTQKNTINKSIYKSLSQAKK